MLTDLTVENIAIIDRATLPLGPGFSALTGETGAGKSLLIDAIGLALGGRADSDLVRSGAAKGSVSLAVDVGGNPQAVAKCAELGVEVEEGTLVVQRDVSAEGRSTVRLNGKPAAVGALREIGALLVDLHGQHDHQALLVPERQIDFLDDWIGDPASELLAEVQERFSAVEGLRRKLNALRTSRREREQRADLLRFQVQEIGAVAPTVGELEALEADLSRLQHAERLAQGSMVALATLSEDEGSALERLGSSVKELAALEALDPTIGEGADLIRQALYALQDGARALRSYAEGVEMDPNRLEEVAGRIDALRKLRRKYGDDEAAVLAYLESAKEELTSLEDSESSEAEVAERLAAAESELCDVATRLSELRRERALEFARRVTDEVRDLAMEKALFEVAVEPKAIEPNGGDRVEFLFTANPGEPLRPLAKVASGGEISRVMLSIKVASAGRAGVPTLIFDEVDTGLSGRAAAVTARKLEALSEHYQVLVISHLPQIAGRADVHFRIEKAEQSGRLVTQVNRLEGPARVQEIARMLAGERVGESALANARELLAR